MTTASETVRRIHRRSGLGLRELARRAGTSHATLRAYETGAKDPRLETLARLATAAGFDLEIELAARPNGEDEPGGREAKGREFLAALELAAAFPARHRRRLDAPVFGRVSSR